MVWGALWAGNEMAFSDTGENTQPRNGLKRNSLVLATHSALCKRPPFLPGAGGKERLSQEMRVVPGWGDKPPALVLIPQEEEGEHFLRAGSKKWDRCFKGKARGGGGGCAEGGCWPLCGSGHASWLSSTTAGPCRPRCPTPALRPPAPVPPCLLPRPRLSLPGPASSLPRSCCHFLAESLVPRGHRAE